MTARLVGWMPNIGRLNAPVGATARLGATADNEVVVRVDGVSRAHAKLVQQPDGYYIEDSGSKNGTWLNGERVTRAKLRHLDVITLGRFAEVVFVARETEVPEPVPAPVEEGLRARLEWLDGPASGQIVDLPPGELIIGRAESCALVVDSDSVSRAHVRLTISDEGVTIEDLGTVNGTAVNGRALTQATPLESGAEVDVGQARRFRLLLEGTPVKGGVERAGTTPIGAQDMEWATRLVWSAKDLEALREASASSRSRPALAAKQGPVAPRPAAPRPTPAVPPPAATPPVVTPPVAASAPAPPSQAVAPAAELPGKETVRVRADHTQLVAPSLGGPPPAIRPAAASDDADGKTRFDPAASVKLPQQFHEDAPTSLGHAAPGDLPTSLGEQIPADRQETSLGHSAPGDLPTSLGERMSADQEETSLGRLSSLDPPTSLERVPPVSDAPTSLPGAPPTADGGRTELGGSPFDLPSNEVVSPEDLPTSLGSQPGAGAVTHMPSNAFNPRDRTNLPPETVLGFRDVGPAARGLGSSAATHLAARGAEEVPSAIPPASPPPAPESMFSIESIRLTGDLGIYVIARGTATVGRSSEATIRIDSLEMSRIHAILNVNEHDVIVEDRGSINGTSVNGTAISGRRTLVHGDRVCFADFEFRLEVKRTEGHP